MLYLDQSKTTTGRPSPPWQITSQPPPVWSTISPTARPPPPPPKISAITTWSPARPTSKSAAGGISSPIPAITTVQPPAAAVATSAVGISPAAAAAAGGRDIDKSTSTDIDYDEDLPKRNDKHHPESEPQSPPQHDLPELEIEKKAEKMPDDTTTAAATSTSNGGIPINRNTGKYIHLIHITQNFTLFFNLEDTATFRHTPTSTSSSPFSLDVQAKCWPVKARNLYWNWTSVNEHAVQPCPGGTTGLARWRCIADPNIDQPPHWSPATPDLSQCRSVWLTNLESRVIEGDSLTSIMSDLSQVCNYNYFNSH